MNLGELISIKTDDESSGKHTRYNEELRLFSCIQQGDINKLIEEMKNLNTSVTTGKLSNDGITQYRYLAVSTITLAIRYAIQGGLNEKEAYDFSDEFIRAVDALQTKEEIINHMALKIIQLTQAVAKSKKKPSQSPHIKRCVSCINENIESKITVSALAERCGLSPDYLSKIFKEEMGENLSSFITRKKLEKSKELIMEKKSNAEICKTLSFSSPSHFITLFKKYFGLTPGEFYDIAK